jgi:hypothetical protein
MRPRWIHRGRRARFRNRYALTGNLYARPVERAVHQEVLPGVPA